ncbi:MAG: cytochrome P450 [Bacillus sp. (in: firmicutes)]
MSSKSDIVLLDEISNLKSKIKKWEPYAWYRENRKKSPVFYDEEQDAWNVFLYEHTKTVLHDHTIFSNEKERSLIPVPKEMLHFKSNVNLVDPPEHRKRRALLSQAFTPRSLKDWEPRIQQIVDELITGFENETTVDIVKKLAIPLPVTIIAELLGVPKEDRQKIKDWSDVIFLPFTNTEFDNINEKKQQAMKEFGEYLYPLVLEKKQNPADDIISDLTKAELKGERLSDMEVVMSSIGLLGAGNETTTTLISHIFYSLLFDRPETYLELRNDLSLVPKLTEETLRYRFPASMDRVITKDTDIFGPQMKKGQMIIAWVGSANRDEKQFSQPDIFDIHRPNNQKHLSFGAGPHFCLGAPLARLEANYALTAFIKKFEDIRPGNGFDLQAHLTDSAIGQTLKSLPVELFR